MILWIALAIFVVLLIMGAPIILCLGVPPVVWLLTKGRIPNMVMGQKMYSAVDSFSLMAIPFFMLAGQIMERTGITEAIVDFANAVIGWVRGGLACTVELAGMLMAGISGSSNADASALGAICLRALKKGGYDEGWAAGVVVSASGIGPIIPPSIIMIVYATAAGLDIGKLFMAGIIPGVLLGLAYMAVSVFYAKKKNIPKIPFQGWKHVWETFRRAVWALLMPVIIIGGILGGLFTATECGVIATVYGIAYGLIARKIKLHDLWISLREGILAAVGPISLIAISSIFSYMLAREGVTKSIANYLNTNIQTGFGVMLFCGVICIIAGCFVDGTATMLLLTPIFVPVVQAMGIDMMQFSIVFMITIMSGGMTPPVGSMLFVISGIDGTPISKMVKPILPFLAALIIVVLLIMLVPGIASWLPGIVYN
ncbi:MAG: TRAP transporter large permease [Oscillospiraceae bacterium]|nr:TRAP transporter large permease [Oscillospiraceae bacterium]